MCEVLNWMCFKAAEYQGTPVLNLSDLNSLILQKENPKPCCLEQLIYFNATLIIIRFLFRTWANKFPPILNESTMNLIVDYPYIVIIICCDSSHLFKL